MTSNRTVTFHRSAPPPASPGAGRHAAVRLARLVIAVRTWRLPRAPDIREASVSL